jgi:hypothetical protein
MAATRTIEEERGTYISHVHPHNGYWAGDFSRREVRTPTVLHPHSAAATPARLIVHRPSQTPWSR